MNMQNYRNHFDRNGTAAVEASLMMPVLLFVFLGAIDIAQYINIYAEDLDIVLNLYNSYAFQLQTF